MTVEQLPIWVTVALFIITVVGVSFGYWLFIDSNKKIKKLKWNNSEDKK